MDVGFYYYVKGFVVMCSCLVPVCMHGIGTYGFTLLFQTAFLLLQVIKNIRNVIRHRNGQSVKSRQIRWEWQL